MKNNKLPRRIAAGIILGVLVGWACHDLSADAEHAKQLAGYFSLVTDIFLRMIKMIIAPLVFATLVGGIASMSSSRSIGRIGLRAMAWFVTASVVSLFIGMALVNIFEPGVGLNLDASHPAAVTAVGTGDFSLKAFIGHVFPRSIAEAMTNNEILQIVVFSLFFGFGLAAVKRAGHTNIVDSIDELAKVMFKITDYVMAFAPIGVFAAIASAITTQGLGLLWDYGRLIAEFYIGIAVLWVVLFAAGFVFLGRSVFTLGKLIREPVLLAFSTASSESAYPKTMEALEKFGAPKRVSSFVLPLGYSFNLDGSMMYQAFAIMFIAQAYNIDLSFTQQLLILLTLMVTSKGMAGVARASIVVVAATLPMFNLPEAGLLLIIGIDQFLDMARTGTNVIGNSIATAVVAKSEPVEDEEDDATVARSDQPLPAGQPASIA
ncbi:dicarboxylate/amino acid:cation symporter [Pseudomonas alloputida]|uniref:Dicarboxylate/amino acid:cation symporter n=1 Tax=Pseudomonas alloputida TaxID=1940621 RepID=A0AAW7HWG9_9PSED|nr:dicarboxylate/amino acid:cation symporter [Pseudomonas alloputida]MCE0860530.1 dicarboxylate/amino acid:cation symporter [Pseudomonas alloputida]MCE0866625.1 dicarboxylate/amino acid:cation symporter [Pseudomonas alloputida]MCE1149305.1 dicarboxylate/amino acid:cation symporter [Pseudomonas alloputida]MDM3954122.1 dicarboxylate/amino acid:cation symporter [Pseudomonas alloputida]WJR19855.1 dicarboxylate/amino acid:cation symporter [Pseudomonas alloputida]